MAGIVIFIIMMKKTEVQIPVMPCQQSHGQMGGIQSVFVVFSPSPVLKCSVLKFEIFLNPKMVKNLLQAYNIVYLKIVKANKHLLIY